VILIICRLLPSGLGYGLRSMAAPAVVCWLPIYGGLHFAGTKLAFIGQVATLVIFTLLAFVELTLDKVRKLLHELNLSD
jgi:uncharacterized membrane protein